jgi:hypothetical protein
MPAALLRRVVSRLSSSAPYTPIRPGCCLPLLLVTSAVPESRLSQVHHPTSAACPQGAASRHAAPTCSRPVRRHSPPSSVSRQDGWPAACACTRMVPWRQRPCDNCPALALPTLSPNCQGSAPMINVLALHGSSRRCMAACQADGRCEPPHVSVRFRA